MEAITQSDPPLCPIVIPPMTVTISGWEFSILGLYLEYDRHAFDADIASALPLLEPARTKKGTIKVNQPHVRSTTRSYWQAQCIFRGLPASGTKGELQSRIRAALASPSGGRMASTMKEEESRLKKEFLAKNALERDRQWREEHTTDEQRAEADPERFLREKFFSGKTTSSSSSNTDVPDTIVLKTSYRSQLHQAAEKLDGLHTQSTDAPLNVDGTRPYVDRWIVIGRSSKSVRGKIAEINSEASRTLQLVQRKRDVLSKAKQAEVLKQMQAKSCSGSSQWDVSGRWEILCPDLDGYTRHHGAKYSLDLIIVEDGKGHAQMYADFDFVSCEGIMRFANQGKTPAVNTKTGNKRKREDEDNSIYEPQFLLHPPLKPSPQHPTWQYRWRGEDTGNGEIQLYSDEELYSITFKGPGGTECSGLIGVPFHGTAEFTGRKIRTTRPQTQSRAWAHAKEAWNRRSEAAYERARVGRWY
jgi:hypothetical protein